MDEVSGYKCNDMGSRALHLAGQIGAEANFLLVIGWYTRKVSGHGY